MKEIIKIILDTDPGIDDAVAIGAALFDEHIDLQLITTVAGNVSVDKTTRNVLKLLDFWDKDVPVARGVSKPLVRKLENASHIHGHSGLDGYEFGNIHRMPLSKHAVEAMRDVLIESDQPITLVAIGPLTNIALLLTLYPECKKNIERIVLMGGSTSRGNYTPNAEFNIYVDPEAAKIVFESGLKIVMCGLDVTSKAMLIQENIEEIKEMNRTGNMLYSLFQHYRAGTLKTGLIMHDPCAIAYLVKPDIFTTQDCFVDIELCGAYTLGTTVVDIRGQLNKPNNATVCVDIDVAKFRTWLINTLRKAP